MLVTPEIDRHNYRYSLVAAIFFAIGGGILGLLYNPLLPTIAFAPLVYWQIRHRCLRRTAVAHRPFPPEWLTMLERRVRFYRGLDDGQKERFRQMVNVFLDEVRITGIRT